VSSGGGRVVVVDVGATVVGAESPDVVVVGASPTASPGGGESVGVAVGPVVVVVAVEGSSVVVVGSVAVVVCVDGSPVVIVGAGTTVASGAGGLVGSFGAPAVGVPVSGTSVVVVAPVSGTVVLVVVVVGGGAPLTFPPSELAGSGFASATDATTIGVSTRPATSAARERR
jgi:hypothetical protein